MGWGNVAWLACACAYVVWAARLSWHDLSSRRLPDRLTLPAVPVAALASLYDDSFAAFAAGALIWSGGYAAVVVVKPGAMGGGDVKLALTLGGLTGWLAGMSGTLLAMVAAGILTAVAGVVTRRTALPHGPSMLIACAGATLGGPMT